MMNRLKTSLVTPALAIALFAGGATGVAALASAQTPATTSGMATTQTHMMHSMGPGGHGRGPGVMGTVSAVDGSTVTITNTDGTTYTVDATNAKVSKMVDLSVSDIKVGDQVGVMGTISGTSVTATHIMDGVPPARQQNQ